MQQSNTKHQLSPGYILQALLSVPPLLLSTINIHAPFVLSGNTYIFKQFSQFTLNSVVTWLLDALDKCIAHSSKCIICIKCAGSCDSDKVNFVLHQQEQHEQTCLRVIDTSQTAGSGKWESHFQWHTDTHTVSEVTPARAKSFHLHPLCWGRAHFFDFSSV